MTERLIDYGLVALVIVVIIGLFRLSRILMHIMLRHLKGKYPVLTADRLMVTGFITLLAGMIFLPFITSVFSLIDNQHLTGGMIFHLLLVALSVVLFSIAEDLFRLFSSYPPDRNWSRKKHFHTISIPLLVFWVIGCLFISPLFYSGLTVILALFYLYALVCRPSTNSGDSGSV
ncbi:MAG: hypothetical protein KAT47_01450 [Candidatus Aegiribacteria sp.]|nr:hypothetical protein [Candidatus Aegiribacteria sp.]